MTSGTTRRQRLGISLWRKWKITLIVAAPILFVTVPSRAGIADILDIFKQIDSTIQNEIGAFLTDIRSLQTSIQQMDQQILWPKALLDQAHGFVNQVVGTYRGWMNQVYNIPIQSAQLPNPQRFEHLFMSGNANGIPQINMNYGATYATLPTAQQALSAVRLTTDMTDAIAKDSLAQSIVSDQATGQMLHLADQIESQVSTAAPGTSPYFSATSLAATLQTQAFQLKLMSAMLREESTDLAHRNAILKQSVGDANQLKQSIEKALTAH